MQLGYIDLNFRLLLFALAVARKVLDIGLVAQLEGFNQSVRDGINNSLALSCLTLLGFCSARSAMVQMVGLWLL